METEEKCNEESFNVFTDFQLISSEDASKRSKNVHLYMQFYFIENFMRFLCLGVKIPSALTDVGMGQFTTTMAYDNLK